MQDRHEVLVKDFLLLVGHNQESAVGLIQFLLGKRVSQLLEAIEQPVTAGAGGEDYAAFRHADVFGPHDLIGLTLLEEAIDMYARAVGERIGADDCLVGWNLGAEHVGDQAAGSVQLARLDAGMHAEVIGARAQRHDDLFQRGVACPLSESVDGALHLARAVEHAMERVGHGHAQVVVAVHADHGAFDSGDVLADAANQRAVLFRHGIAGGVGNIDHGGAGGDDGGDHLEQVGRIGAPGIFRIELDLIDELPRQFHGIDGHLQNLAFLFGQCFAVAFILELAIDVYVRGADSGVYAGTLALGQSFAAGLDVGGDGTRERADGGPLDLAANQLHGLEILGRGVRIARFDHVHVQLCQLPGEDEFLAAPQAGSGGLFSVSQGGVEYRDFFRHDVAH